MLENIGGNFFIGKYGDGRRPATDKWCNINKYLVIKQRQQQLPECFFFGNEVRNQPLLKHVNFLTLNDYNISNMLPFLC